MISSLTSRAYERAPSLSPRKIISLSLSILLGKARVSRERILERATTLTMALATYYELYICSAGIGRVALDVRLGCLGEALSPDSEPQKIIDAAKFALRNVAALELKAPYWRYVPTPLWSRYVRNMNYFIE